MNGIKVQICRTRIWFTLGLSLLVAMVLTACEMPAVGPVLAETVKVQVTGTVVNLRYGPGLEYEVMDQVRQGDILAVSGRSEDAEWLHVTPEGESLWIFADLTDIDADVRANLPVMMAPPAPEEEVTTGST